LDITAADIPLSLTIRMHPVYESPNSCEVALVRPYVDAGSKSMSGHIHDGNKGKSCAEVFVCVMPDHITAYQISESASDENI
jgi:hypothetical protein